MTIKIVNKKNGQVNTLLTAIYKELLQQDIDKLTLAPQYKIVFEDDLK